jgi:hypothetical protein
MIHDVSVVDDFNRANGVISSPWGGFGTALNLAIENTSVLWNGALSSGWFGGAAYTSVSGLNTVNGFKIDTMTNGEWLLLSRIQNQGLATAYAYYGYIFSSAGAVTPQMGLIDAAGNMTEVTGGISGYVLAAGDKLSLVTHDLPNGFAKVALYFYDDSDSKWRLLAARHFSGSQYYPAGPTGLALKVNLGGQHQRLDDYFAGTITAPTPSTISSDIITGYDGTKRDKLAEYAADIKDPANQAVIKAKKDVLAERAWLSPVAEGGGEPEIEYIYVGGGISIL